VREGWETRVSGDLRVLTSFRVREPSDRSARAASCAASTEGGEEDPLVDFFVRAGGADGSSACAELIRSRSTRRDPPDLQMRPRHTAAGPGTAAGLEHSHRRRRLRAALSSSPSPGPGRTRVGLLTKRRSTHEICPNHTSTPEGGGASFTPDGSAVEGRTSSTIRRWRCVEEVAAGRCRKVYRGRTSCARGLRWVRERGGGTAGWTNGGSEPKRAPGHSKIQGLRGAHRIRLLIGRDLIATAGC